VRKIVLQSVAAKINWLCFDDGVDENGEPKLHFIKLGYNVQLSNGFIVKMTLKKGGTNVSIWQKSKLKVGPTGHLIAGQPEPKDENVFKGSETMYRKTYAHCQALINCVDRAIDAAEAEAAAKMAAARAA
jgi:hypothetical protein